MIKYVGVLALFVTGIVAIQAQENNLLNRQVQFFDELEGTYEGYKISECKNLISYYSLRNDVTEGMLTRATDGEMEISWQTETIEESFQAEGAWFVWIAAIDLTDKSVRFDISVDGQKRFELHSGQKESFTLHHPDGGIIKYHSFHLDQHGDSHGYMALYAPKAWLQPGKPLHLKIGGEAAGENTWVIVFKADDIKDNLQKSIQFQAWLDLSIKKKKRHNEITVTAPVRLAGKSLHYNWGKNEGSLVLKESEGQCTAQVNLKGNIPGDGLVIRDDLGELVDLDQLKIDTVSRKLLSKSVIVQELSIEDGVIQIKSRRVYKPKTVNSLLALNRSSLSGGKILLMNSSHQDIAWMDSPEKCILERDTMLITPLIEQALSTPGYRFDIEDALMIKEYVERHPDKHELMGKLLREGKISCGSSYTQPYEEMYSGEALVRQFYLGRKWLKDQFGYNANTYWNVDVPGRSLQMPQILKGSGTDYMMISRHAKGIFNWYSPDGSYVTAYSSGHYAEAYTPLQKDFFEAAEYIAASSMDWNGYFSEGSASGVVPLLSDWDMSPAIDYSDLINQWESINELKDEKGVTTQMNLPGFRIVTAPELFDSFTDAANPLPSISGERPALWLYIHGPGHQKALKASREGDILLTVAEKFATLDALTEGSFRNYPQERLHRAWEAKIYPDHGWGGKNGQITDDLFRRKFEFARSEALQVIENATRSISSKINTQINKGIPVIVFNSLSWERTDVVDFEMQFEEGEARSVVVKDKDGNPMTVQCQALKHYPDGSLESVRICLMAEGVPSVGYKAFYLQPHSKAMESNREDALENPYYKIAFADGGLQSIYDKELQKELVDDSKFVAGEVFTMQSAGNGAGEFDKIQQPSMKGFDKTGNHPGVWELRESGEVFTSWTKRTQLPHAVVEQKIRLFHAVKRVDFDIALLNWTGELFREFRMALPLNMKQGQVAYEVPFGVVEVGKDEMEGAAGERYQVDARDLHPRGIENWLGASDQGAGVTLSSSVTVADYMDPTDDPEPYPILQPLLLASRVSCHWEGNQYLQTGNHHFSFSLSSHLPGWENGYHTGRQANEKLRAVVDPRAYKSAHLPESQSFFGVEDPNLIISAVKKAEDDQSVVVRIFDAMGKDTRSMLKTSYPFRSAQQTNLIEESLGEVEVSASGVTLDLGHHQIETLMLKK